jgi:histidinol-phosphatase (PHP family)
MSDPQRVGGLSAVEPAPPGDYHVHTTFSDGEGTIAACVEQAIAVGLPEIGIADHLSPVQPGPWETATIPFALLDRYVAEVHEARRAYPEIVVLLGVEADYAPEQEAELAKLLSAYPFDYVVGGVHVVEGFEFDDPARRHDPRWSDPDALFTSYYRIVRRAAELGRFDVIAHLDYIGLWGHVAGAGVDAEVDAALTALAASGGALELNTDRISDPAGVMYPSLTILRRARGRGIPLVISSDAHRAEHVGRLWDEAIATAAAAGYSAALRLSDKTLVPLPRVT